jgi:hypothetical protein
MDTLNLHSDESIILAMQDIVVSGVRIDVILTGTRLICVESGGGGVLYGDIPLETISSVAAGENARSEPTVTLSVTPPAGETRRLELIFFQRPGFVKTGERDRLAEKLGELLVPSQVQARGDALSPPAPGAGAQPATGPDAGPAFLSGAPEAAPVPLTARIPAASSRHHPPSVLDRLIDRVPLIAVPALLVILVAVLGGAFTYMQVQHELSAGPPAPAAVPTIITGTAATPAPAVPQAGAGEEILPESSPPMVMIPQSGVWVRVQYPGTFLGSVGARGVYREVNATGDRFYQLAAQNDIIDVSIAKQDGSNNLLAVEVYRDGSQVRRSTTSTPRGIIDLHVNLKS